MTTKHYALEALRRHAKRTGTTAPAYITVGEARAIVERLDALAAAGRLVVERWESGDLAEAVRALAELVKP